MSALPLDGCSSVGLQPLYTSPEASVSCQSWRVPSSILEMPASLQFPWLLSRCDSLFVSLSLSLQNHRNLCRTSRGWDLCVWFYWGHWGRRIWHQPTIKERDTICRVNRMYPSEVSRRRPKHLCWTGQWRKDSVSHTRQTSGVRTGYFCPDACQVSAFSLGLSCRNKRRFDSPLFFCTTDLIYINTKYLIPSCSYLEVWYLKGDGRWAWNSC